MTDQGTSLDTHNSFVENTSTPLYSQFIHLSRYSRWIETKGRRETWEETVDRYLTFFSDTLSSATKSKQEYDEIYNFLRRSILDLKSMPSMRAMMTAGKALSKDSVSGYNPVAGDTLVLTYEHGLVPIKTLSGSSCKVLNVEGRWADATFRSYGEQPVVKANFRLNSNTRKEVHCTLNHRWVLSDGTVVPTERLQPGDWVKFVAGPKPEPDTLDYRLGVQHGFIYGDGTATYSQERLKGYHIRICSDKEDTLPWFSEYPVCYPPSYGGDPVVMMYGSFAKTHELKELPSADETDQYLLGFMRGWLAADGTVSATSQVSLAVGLDEISWINKVASRLGYVVQSKYEYPEDTNFGKRTKKLWCLSFSRSSMCSEDFLIERKRNRFKELESHYVFTGISGEPTSTEVFCAEVPDTNTFVLDMGLVTGNCSYLPIDHQRSFDELMYILMCGTGVGFSVERQYINKLPEVADAFHEVDTVISVADSKIGWASSLRQLITLLYSGMVPKWDLSKIRPAGARLKTFGGRASGPAPLESLFKFCVSLFKKAAGRKLSSLECHDLVCKIADIVVVGGVRRSALISLSNLSDDRMRLAKSGQWWVEHPHRALANNSASYTEKPEYQVFLNEWLSLYESKSGERGIFSRYASKRQVMKNGRRDPEHDFGTNPCSEIILRPYQFCNLSEVVVRSTDTLEDLLRKVEAATVLGTLQSTVTNFRYLRPIWKKNTEEERLLGVSLTGIMDHPVLGDANSSQLVSWLDKMRERAVEVNKIWADKLGINQSTAITCVKPSGTVSQLVDSASGIHPRFSKFYIRRVRCDKKDPLASMMSMWGFPCEEDVMNPNVWVFSFPIKAPETACTTNEIGAMEQLQLWKLYQDHWCEHKPSITVYYRDSEFLEVGSWVWNNLDSISGISFLPHSDHVYQQAPYEEITEAKYLELLSALPTDVDWSALSDYETQDMTAGSQTLACAGGVCEVVDLVENNS